MNVVDVSDDGVRCYNARVDCQGRCDGGREKPGCKASEMHGWIGVFRLVS